MPPNPVSAARRLILLLAALAYGLPDPAAFAAEAPRETTAGRLEFDGASDYSHIRIRRRGDMRSLLFVRDSGEEVYETKINLRHPAELQFPYLRYMFTSYLFRDQQQDVLIVGLGGGAMVHFLRRCDPQVRIDVVEIDPLVVKLADQFFGVRSGENVNIATDDGLKFIAEPKSTKAYDVIYLDAFLKPSAETDASGVPLSLRTRQFYEKIQTKLKPGGLAAFNINPHPQVRDDIRAIVEAFPQAYEFQLPQSEGIVVVASTDPQRLTREQLLERAGPLDERFETSIRFLEMARRAPK